MVRQQQPRRQRIAASSLTAAASSLASSASVRHIYWYFTGNYHFLDYFPEWYGKPKSGMVFFVLIVLALADLFLRAVKPQFPQFPTFADHFELKTGLSMTSKSSAEADLPNLHYLLQKTTVFDLLWPFSSRAEPHFDRRGRALTHSDGSRGEWYFYQKKVVNTTF